MSDKIQEQVTLRTFRAVAEVIRAVRERRQLVWSDGGERAVHVRAQGLVDAGWDPLPDDADLLEGFLLVKTWEGALERRWTVAELADALLDGSLTVI